VLGGELNGDTSGASILESAVGARKEAFAHTVPLKSEETRVQAESVFQNDGASVRHRARRSREQRQTARGQLRGLQGLGPLFSGKYYVTEVRIRFDGVKASAQSSWPNGRVWATPDRDQPATFSPCSSALQPTCSLTPACRSGWADNGTAYIPRWSATSKIRTDRVA